MKLLILGGSIFLGRYIVEAALAREHEVTLFNRGMHNSDLFPNVEKLRGDRNQDLSALRGRNWDAVIDTSGFVPRQVQAPAQLLAGTVDHYTFISSISVYADFSKAGIDESCPVGTLEDTTVEEVSNETYGPLKALCEQAAEAAMPGHVLVVRPGLIIGPNDPSDRFTYWPHRIAQGGEVLAPEQRDQPVQFIDVRDLAQWIVRMVEYKQTGKYNATGPNYLLTMEQVLKVCKDVIQSNAHFTWVSEQFLLDNEVGAYVELPLWIPSTEPETAGHNSVNCSKAISAGLTFRPLADTVRDTLAWNATRPPDVVRHGGLKPEREAQLLQAWHTHDHLPPEIPSALHLVNDSSER
jgi:2'-hydroxyisoflavone reductase